MTSFSEALKVLMEGQSLTRPQTRDIVGQLMRGELTAAQIAALLVLLRVKGETVEEIAGAAEAMRDAAVKVNSTARPLVDTCGTGGDASGSFNVSTAAAFVVSAAGFSVAKHGNRSISSKCGSADLLEALGVPVELSRETAERCLQEVGIVFLFAPAYHPAMKHAMPIRKELATRTIFNLLGPLTNPARPTVQLIGVFQPQWVEPLARVLVELGCRQGAVVHGQGHDELVLSGASHVVEIVNGRLERQSWEPVNFGLKQAPDTALRGGSPADNAAILGKLFDGEKSAYRDAVCMNAAAAIRSAAREQGRELSLKESAALAAEAIDSRKAAQKLEALRDFLGVPKS